MEPVVGADGLSGEWLSLEEVAALDIFNSAKRAFKIKLSGNFASRPGQREPGIKAAVKRQYQKGDIICKAADYGSTAFLLLEGTASAMLPSAIESPLVSGRTSRSLGRLRDLFARRTQRHSHAATLAGLGEVSPYASLSATRPPAPMLLTAGDLFGIDTCINFYPREATVRAEEPCVVLEMLRAVLDTIREAGEHSGELDAAYSRAALRNHLVLTPWLEELREDERESLAASSNLLTGDADEVRDGVIYREGDLADAVYLIRAGTVKLAQQRSGREVVVSYLGRGAAFGFEPVLNAPAQAPLFLTCVEPADGLPAVALSDPVTVGRKADCQVVVPADRRGVGRQHCRFELRDGDLYVRDLDSANGTIVNGERVREAIVTVGDRVTIVDYTFEIVRRAPEGTTGVARQSRRATAAALDSVEIVKLPGRELRRLAALNPGFAEALAAAARTLGGQHAPVEPPDAQTVGEFVDLNLYNSQNTLLIDLDRCTRCDECVRACADAHGGVARFTRAGPRFGKYLVTLACRSCTDPKCMIGCPVGSIRREGSLEIRIEDWCIGCQRCANQCPFGNINMQELVTKPEPATVASGPMLRATVCDLCAGYDGPNCVYACPHDAAIRVNPAAFLSAVDLR